MRVQLRGAIRALVVLLLVLHGLIHVLGAVKGLGRISVPGLEQPVSRAVGVAWLLAAALMLATAWLLARRSTRWWVAGTVAVAVSQAVILTSWDDAAAGTVVNVLVLAASGYGFAALGPFSYRTEYARRASAALAEPAPAAVATEQVLVTELDLTGLPDPVAGYLRGCGVVGQPQVRSLRATIHGRIRSGTGAPWMSFTGEQTDTFGSSPTRLFLLDASMAGLPVDVLHVLTGGRATMRVKACSLVTMVNAAGPEMDRGESVTLFNDLCVLAPSALIDAAVEWVTLNDHQVRGTFTHGSQRVSADLRFDQDHRLIDFVSSDRLRAAADGRSFTSQQWSTPLRDYRSFGGCQIAATGEGRWHAPPPEGEFTYIEFHVDDITYNHARRPPQTRPAGTSASGPVRRLAGR